MTMNIIYVPPLAMYIDLKQRLWKLTMNIHHDHTPWTLIWPICMSVDNGPLIGSWTFTFSTAQQTN